MRSLSWIVLSSLLVLPMPAAVAAGPTDTFTAGAFLVTLDGEAPEPVQAVEGGDAVGVVESVPGPGGIPDKNLVGPVMYEPLSIRFQPGDGALARWVNEGLPPMLETRSGVITSASTTGQAVAERTFTDALVSRVLFPKLDAASKDPASLILLAQPKATTYELAGGGTPFPASTKQKKFLASNFRLTIDGLDTSQVATIDAITVTQALEPDGQGGFEPTGIELPNLVVSLGASSAATWFEWFEDFVVDGNNADGFERSGKIDYLTPDLKSVIGTLELHGLGIVAIGAERADGWITKKGAKAASGRVIAELYVEQVKLVPGP